MIRLLVVSVVVALVSGQQLLPPGEIAENERLAQQEKNRPPGRLVDPADGFQPHVPHHPVENLQNEIINEVLGPAYYDRVWVLDYRYLPSGGRAWVQGPGGQVLILPEKARTPEESYDHLLEELKKKEMKGELMQIYGPGHTKWPTEHDVHARLDRKHGHAAHAPKLGPNHEPRPMWHSG